MTEWKLRVVRVREDKQSSLKENSSQCMGIIMEQEEQPGEQASGGG